MHIYELSCLQEANRGTVSKCAFIKRAEQKDIGEESERTMFWVVVPFSKVMTVYISSRPIDTVMNRSRALNDFCKCSHSLNRCMPLDVN